MYLHLRLDVHSGTRTQYRSLHFYIIFFNNLH
ncbi:unnamed protein product [Schistosoma curassoni]|uniref:Uncharacterized protein n=1 Tax=Schistosoma curassoni TaxID=6186 RepID=A0A183KTK9_9TREM|nr:unnamed protein product [Schistosoma curassoni]